MAEKNKKARITRGVDRLSSLPDGVLLVILSFLDTKYAVKTTVLSKRWRNLWTSVPDLNFSSQAFLPAFCSDQRSRSLTVFKNFVRHALKRRDRNAVGRFRLFSGSHDNSLLNRVVNYAISHKVCHLIINLKCQYNSYRVPEAVLMCPSLKSLELTNLILGDSLGSTSLTTLHLSYCTIQCRRRAVDPFAACHNLDDLRLHYCRFERATAVKISGSKIVELSIQSLVYDSSSFSIKISAPKLEFFSYRGWKTEDISLIHSPCLKHVDIDAYARMTAGGNNLFNLFVGIRDSEIVSLGPSVIEALSKVPDMFAMKPLRFSRLKKLKLKTKSDHLTVPLPLITYLTCGSPFAKAMPVEFQKER